MKSNNIVCLNYDGFEIHISEDGWIDATIASLRYNKNPYEWLRLPTTREYIDALERKYGKIPYYKTKRGQNGGTWIHPKLAVLFARWLDIDFAVWCDEQIYNLIKGQHPHYDWKRIRHESSSSYKVMSALVQLTREKEGKETKFFHYANEAKLVNYAMTGEYKPLLRDELNYDDLDLLCKLEELNSVLIGYGVSRDERKNVLLKKVSDFRLMITD